MSQPPTRSTLRRSWSALIPAVATALTSPTATADIRWQGSPTNSVFDAASWDFSTSSTTAIVPNVPVQDDLLITGPATALIPDVGGGAQQRLQLAAGHILTIDHSTLTATGNDGVTGSTGAGGAVIVRLANGSTFVPTFVSQDVLVEVDHTSVVRFLGSGNPINGSLVHLEAGARLEFTAETPSAFLSEHLGKVSVDGHPGVVGVNLVVQSDGAAGSIVTAVTSAAADSDGDTLTDAEELTLYQTNPLIADTDGDGTPDGLEVARGLDPLNASESLDRPNIVFILCDDLGYGDLGVLFQNAVVGNKRLHTPNLDRLIGEGALLTRHYCPAPVCAPSRASLLVGEHQGHADVRDNQFDKALEPDHNVASVLAQAGYATALIGKWGLQGSGKGPATWPAYPTKVGFDEFFGYVRHGDGHTHYPAHVTAARPKKQLYDGPSEVSASLERCYTADLFTARAKKFLQDRVLTAPEQPFFLLLAYDTPHAALHLPTQAYPAGGGLSGGMQWLGASGQMITTATGTIDSFVHPDYRGLGWTESEERFATIVRRIDDCVGDVFETLADLGIDEETLVVVTSDNGPHLEAYTPGLSYGADRFDSFGPLDGVKRDAYEGGIRMPTFVRWPGTISAGTVDSTPGQFHDWLATFGELSGWAPPSGTDGVPLLGALMGSGERPESTVYVEYTSGSSTPGYAEFEPVRRGRVRRQMQAVFVDGYKGLRVNVTSHAAPFEVYDTLNDPGEATDLQGTSPYFVALEARMRDEVLRLRKVEPSAPRPWDGDLVPGVQLGSDLEPGLRVATAEGLWPWVPDLDVEGLPTEFDAASLDVKRDLPRPSNAALRYSGLLEVPSPGQWTFELASDEGAVLRLHRILVIDDDHAHTALAASGSVRLEAGLHPITLDYYTRQETPTLELRWQGPGVPLQAVPDLAWKRVDRSIGSEICGGQINSTGGAASTSIEGLALIAANDVTLEAHGLPPGSFGFFLTSRVPGYAAGPAGSSGDLCLGGAIGRYVAPGETLQATTAGTFSLDLNLSRIPTPTGFISAQSGETRYFQAWYRDAHPLPTSNFTSAAAVVLQ